MTLTKEELEIKLRETEMPLEDVKQIMQNQEDAEKYRQLKEKIKQIEDDSYLLDRLEACDTSGAAEIFREFLTSE